MRITGGKFKGRKLVYPRSGLRPTKGVTREAIFNIIGERVDGARVCDLFAGAGALGMEALSRGAKEVVFVEGNPVVCRYLRENLVGVSGARVIRGDVRRVVPRLAGAEFDIIFADPPYGKGLVQRTVVLVFAHNLLAPDGLLVIEHSRDEVPVAPAGGTVVRQERYGESVVTFLRR